jgi:hypothetical protein
MVDVQEKLMEIMKIEKDPHLHFTGILNYMEMVKNYEVTSGPYRCEWLKPIVLKELITHCSHNSNDLSPNVKVGYVSTYNSTKVQKVI